MAYILIENFSAGVDRSRPRFAGVPGSLYSGINGHLSRGGDFEKRKAFSGYAALPANTFGLAKTAAGLWTFGSAAAPAMPAGVSYQRVAHPTDTARTMAALLSWDLFNGKLYVIVQYDDNSVRHFYDGVVVADWDTGGTKPTGYGTLAKTHKRKLYSPIVSILWGSSLDGPTVFNTAVTGSFFQNLSNHASGSDQVTGLGIFQTYLAILARRVIQLWDMQNDPANNAPIQTLTETGTRSPRSVLGFGDVDCFYLSDAGVRSLRARVGVNTAGVNDVGTPIDKLIQEWVATLTDADVQNAVAVVEPLDSRFWLAIGTRIFVFTYFPSKKISGWTWYEPGVKFSDLVTVNNRVYGRAGNTVYIYGGTDNATYGSDYAVTAALPFLSGGKPGTFKQINGWDIAAEGKWNTKLLVNPKDENEYIDVGDIDGFSFDAENTPVPGHCTHIAPLLVHQGEGAASLSKIALYTDGAEHE